MRLIEGMYVLDCMFDYVFDVREDSVESISDYLLIIGHIAVDKFSFAVNFFQFMYICGYGGARTIGVMCTFSMTELWSNDRSSILVTGTDINSLAFLVRSHLIY